MKLLYAFVSLLALTACTGSLYTVPAPKPDSSGRIPGILVYQPRQLILIYEFTIAVDDAGNVADKPCTPVRSFELATVTDTAHPYAVRYDPGLLESKTVSMELEKGVLTKINIQSTPGTKELTDLLSTLIGAAKDVASRGGPTGAARPLCNNGKKLVGYMNVEDLCRQTPGHPCP